jgi:glycosyltransferase 2 family protein
MSAGISPRARVWLWRLVKVLAAFACIAFVLTRADLGQVGTAMRNVGARSLFVLAALAACHVVTLTLRWRAALRSLGEDPRFLPLMGDLLVGAAYNSVLPSTVGGDVVRAYRCATRVKHPPAAVASIALERVIGFLCLSVVPLLGLLLGSLDAPAILLSVSLAATAVFGALLAFLHVPLAVLGRIVAPVAPKIAAFVSETAADLRAVRTKGRLVVALWSMVYQALSMAFFLVVAGSWQAPASPQAVLIGVPIAMILSSLPITIGGIGLRESLFVAVLGKLGVPGGQALFMAFIWGIEWLVLALLGAVLVAATRLSRPKLPGEREPSADSASL